MANRSYDKNALPLIYSMKVVKAEVNHEMAMYLKSCFEKKSIKLLIGDIQGREHLIDKADLLKKNPEEQANLLKPYVNTTILVNEMLNLEYEMRSGYVKVYEIGRNRKDRYSSLAMANYYAKQLEAKLKKPKKSNDITEMFQFKAPVITRK